MQALASSFAGVRLSAAVAGPSSRPVAVVLPTRCLKEVRPPSNLVDGRGPAETGSPGTVARANASLTFLALYLGGHSVRPGEGGPGEGDIRVPNPPFAVTAAFSAAAAVTVSPRGEPACNRWMQPR